MTWDTEECSDTYNVYRKTGLLLDPDGDGVANDYGGCYQNDVMATGVNDLSKPPVGSMYVYAVSGQNLNGEGSIGYASNGRMRPNVTPCP
jgi:hypothetical protein